MLSNSIDIGYMPQTDIPQLNAVKQAGYHVFGYPDWGFTYVNYNFADKTGDFNNIINQLYVRQALAHLEDEEGYIKALLPRRRRPGLRADPGRPGVAVHPGERAEEPVPVQRQRGGQPAEVARLEGGARRHSTCAKPGTGAGECGAGIPAGTKLTFNVLYAN